MPKEHGHQEKSGLRNDGVMTGTIVKDKVGNVEGILVGHLPDQSMIVLEKSFGRLMEFTLTKTDIEIIGARVLTDAEKRKATEVVNFWSQRNTGFISSVRIKETENMKTEKKEHGSDQHDDAGEKETTPEQYQIKYLKAETWGEGEAVVMKLSTKQLLEYIDAHETVKKYTGLDMRQDFILGTARAVLNNRLEKIRISIKRGGRRICAVCRNDGGISCHTCDWITGKYPTHFDKIEGVKIPDNPEGTREIPPVEMLSQTLIKIWVYWNRKKDEPLSEIEADIYDFLSRKYPNTVRAR